MFDPSSGAAGYSALKSDDPGRTAAKARDILGLASRVRPLGGASSPTATDASASGMAKAGSVPLRGLGIGDGLGTLARAPVVELHQMSVARALAWPVCTILVFLLVAASGVVLMIPDKNLPGETLFHSHMTASSIGITLLVLGLLGPCLCLRGCVWWNTPSAAQRKQSAWFADSMLEELQDQRNLLEHITVYGADKADAGTIIMLPGAAAPRGTLAPLASLVCETFRVITVDLPGQGTLSAVPYSLARCELVLSRVVRRAQLSCPGKRIVLAAQGAAAYVACHFALRPASEPLTAGLVVMGRVPDYVGIARCQCSFDSLYVMQWAAVFANRALKARVAASDWPPLERRVAGQSDFNMAAIPDIRTELHGLSLIYPLRDFKRTVIFLGPRAWVEEAEELVPVRHAQARRVRGARDDTLPPVDGVSIDNMAAEVTEYASEIPTEDWAMEDDGGDDMSIALSRPSMAHSFTVPGNTSVTSGSMSGPAMTGSASGGMPVGSSTMGSSGLLAARPSIA